MTSDLVELLGRLPRLDAWTTFWIIMTLSLIRHLVHHALDEGDVPQCAARHVGSQCVHLDGHRGSHRTEQGEYWNE